MRAIDRRHFLQETAVFSSLAALGAASTSVAEAEEPARKVGPNEAILVKINNDRGWHASNAVTESDQEGI